jgi:gluconolactonase
MKTILVGFILFAGLGLQAAESTLLSGELKTLGADFKFTEGPAADADGNVYFTDIRAEQIHKYSTDGTLELFRENTGGANGLYFDPSGNLYACEGLKGRVTSITTDGNVTVLADRYHGKGFNKPNDLWIDPKGGVYFTDPAYGKTVMKQDGEHVYYLTPDHSKIIRVIDNFTRPNGLIGTPDGKILYVADAGAEKIWRYTIGKDSTLSDKTLFAETRSDGMTLDAAGNLYTTENSVLIYNPEGVLIEDITLPNRPTNVTFGGKDHRTLFITARTHLCAVEMNIKGMTQR